MFNNYQKEKVMKKKLFLIALLLVFALISCGGEEDDDWGNDGDDGNSGNNDGNGGWISQEGQDGKILETRGLIYALTIGTDDTIYIGGETRENLYSELQGEKNAFLATFNSKGKELWGKQWSSNDDYDAGVRSIAVDKRDSNIYIGEGGYPPYLIKFAPDGTKIWEESSEFNVITSLALDLQQNAYISYNGEILKYSTDGKEMQRYNISSSSTYIEELFVDSEGNIYAGGNTYENLFAEKAGNIDAFLVKLAPDGTQLWGKQWGSKGEDRIRSIRQASDGNIFVLSYTDTNFRNDVKSLSKFSPNGEKIWEKTEINGFSVSMCSDDIYVYVLESDKNARINHYNLEGEFLGSSAIFENNPFNKMVTCDSKGSVYAVTLHNHVIKFAPSDFK